MDIDIFLHAFTSYFVIIDPIGAGLAFAALTSDLDRGAANRLAGRITIIALLIILLCGALGENLLGKLGISIEALRVSGGLLLFYTAFTMVIGRQEKKIDDAPSGDIAVYPMAIPLIAGPGCLALTVLLFSTATPNQALTALVPAIALVIGLTLISLLLADRVRALIGRTGDAILRRLFGVILAALAIQFIADGIRQIAGV